MLASTDRGTDFEKTSALWGIPSMSSVHWSKAAMSNWSSCALLCVMCVAVLSGQGPTPAQDEQLRKNALVLRAALPLLYPTLSAQPVAVYPDWNAGMTTVLGAIGAPVRRTEEAPVGPLQIEARVVLGYVTWLKAVGTHVHSAELDRMAAEFTKNRGTLDDLARALQAMGAKFGPGRGRVLVEANRRRQLEKVFGKIVVKSASFEWLATWETTYRVVAPTWRVVVEATPRNSPPRCVDLVFEPISGELVHVFAGDDLRDGNVSFAPCGSPARP